MASGDISPDRYSHGEDRSRTARKCPGERGQAKIPQTRWRDFRRSETFFPQRFFAFMKGIADTGFVVAAANRDDEYHAWAAKIARSITEPLLTCEAVLAESAFHLGSAAYVLSLVQDGMLKLAFDCTRNLEQLTELADRYRDRKPDLADLCLVRMSELYPRHTILTVDESDFRVYRRNKRDTIPILCPPR